MDFFEAQDHARVRTRYLVILFLLAVGFIIAAVYGVVSVGLISFYTQQSEVYRAVPFWEPTRFAVIALGTALIILVSSGTRVLQFGQGGGAVARSLGGFRVDPTTRHPDEQQLIHVIEEMSIASGTAMPEVYILEGEEGINAFAAGFSPNDAAIAVTRGCLDTLSRDELQGVIAHEFSHILNGDMHLNLRLAGILFGILVIGIIGRLVFEVMARGSRGGGSRNRKGGGGAIIIIILVGLAIMVIGYVGEFFGRLIQAAVSRQREFLADAAAVQFTRNPGGIGGALKKIGGFAKHSKINNSQASGIAHCFFGNALKNSAFSLMATHPPLADRIRAIEPDFDGRFVTPKRRRAGKRAAPPVKATPRKPGAGKFGVEPMALVAMVGQLQANQVTDARSLLRGLSEDFAESLRDPLHAAAAILALALDTGKEMREGQLKAVADADIPDLAEAVRKASAEIQTADINLRIPIIEIACPPLKALSSEVQSEFLRTLDVLINYDETVSLFEFCLRRIVRQRISPERPTGREPISSLRQRDMPELIRAASLVLSAAVHLTKGESVAKKAILARSAQASPLLGGQLRLIPESDLNHIRLDEALDLFHSTPFGVRKQFLRACANVVAYDGKITQAEAELLRAISVGIDCPMPPIMPTDAD